MNTGRLEVRYGDCILEITPDWFVITDITDSKYVCETKDAYPRNMLEFIYSGKDNKYIENSECWGDYLTFDDEWVNDHLQCLIAAYANGEIEDYLDKHWMSLLRLNIDAKYTK